MAAPIPAESPAAPVNLDLTLPPADFNTKSQSDKVDWLQKHGSPSMPSVSLYDCYRQEAKLTHFFKAISNFVKNIHTKAVGDAKIWATKMINTFNAGLWELAQRIKTDCDYLLAHGKYSEDCMLPDPVDFQRLETQDTYSPGKVHSHTLKSNERKLIVPG